MPEAVVTNTHQKTTTQQPTNTQMYKIQKHYITPKDSTIQQLKCTHKKHTS